MNVRLLIVSILLLFIPAVDAATVSWTGGDTTWSEPDDNSFSATYTAGDDAIINAVGTITIDGAGVNPGSVEFNTTGLTLTGGSISGTGTLIKTGSGSLHLQSANIHSGGTVVRAGVISLTGNDNQLGSSASRLTLDGGGVGGFTTASSRDVHVTSNGGFINPGGNADFAFTGVLSGEGPLTFLSGNASVPRKAGFYNKRNTFAGGLVLGNGNNLSVTFNSLLDSTNGLRCIGGGNWCVFRWGSGATNALLMNQRQISLAGSKAFTIDNDNSSYGIIIGTNILVPSSNNQIITLEAASGPINTISGSIPDGTAGATVSLVKSGAGTWSLSGLNTYTGDTTVNGGTLAVSGRSALPDTGTLHLNSGALQIDEREAVGALMTNGVAAVAGTYGSSSSPAQFKDDTWFSGSDILYVGVPLPPAGTLIVLK